MQTTKDKSLSQRKSLLTVSYEQPALRPELKPEHPSGIDTAHPPPPLIPSINPLVTLSIKIKSPADPVPIAASPLIYLSGHALMHLFIYSARLFVYNSHDIPLRQPPLRRLHFMAARTTERRAQSAERGQQHRDPELMMSWAAGLSQAACALT